MHLAIIIGSIAIIVGCLGTLLEHQQGMRKTMTRIYKLSGTPTARERQRAYWIQRLHTNGEQIISVVEHDTDVCYERELEIVTA